MPDQSKLDSCQLEFRSSGDLGEPKEMRRIASLGPITGWVSEGFRDSLGAKRSGPLALDRKSQDYPGSPTPSVANCRPYRIRNQLKYNDLRNLSNQC